MGIYRPQEAEEEGVVPASVLDSKSSAKLLYNRLTCYSSDQMTVSCVLWLSSVTERAQLWLSSVPDSDHLWLSLTQRCPGHRTAMTQGYHGHCLDLNQRCPGQNLSRLSAVSNRSRQRHFAVPDGPSFVRDSTQMDTALARTALTAVPERTESTKIQIVLRICKVCQNGIELCP